MGRKNTEKDYWNKVDSSRGVAACWPWTGSVNYSGYGKTHYQGKEWRANRLSWYFYTGEIPVMACHSCDNPGCCNPFHLFNSTHKGNMRDMQSKKRAARQTGVTHGQNKYSESIILELRADYANGLSAQSLASKYNMHVEYARQIAYRKRWKHI